MSALAIEPPPSTALWRNLALIAVVTWGGAVWWVCRRQRRLPAWLVLGDAALFATVVFHARWLLPLNMVGDGSTWVSASLSASMLLLAWALRPVWACLVAAAEIIAFLAGVALAGHPPDGGLLFVTVVYPIQLILGLLVVRMMRRKALTADDALVQLEEEQRTRAIERARIRDADEQRLALHDTVLTTLTAVARGGVAGRGDLVRRRARMDLDQLSAAPVDRRRDDTHVMDVWAVVWPEAEVRGVALSWVGATEIIVPVEVADAIGFSLREALSNVERHAGVDRAEVRVSRKDDEVTVSLSDAGTGFEPSTGRGRSFGLQHSIVRRMAEVGGQARIVAREGGGTTVSLSWRRQLTATPEATDRFGPLLTRAYAGGLARALTLVAVAWHITTSLMLVTNFDTYRWPAGNLAAWVALLAVGIWLLLQQPGKRITALAGLLALGVVVAATVVGVITCQSEGLIDKANWAIGDFGWFLVALAAHRPMREIAVAWPIVPLVDLWAAARQGPDGPVGHTVSILVAVTSLQVGSLIMYRILDRNGHQSATALREAHRIRTELAAQRAVSDDRARRYRNLETTLLPMARGLADGTVDPNAEQTQTDAWVAAGMLRALLEHDADHASATTVDVVAQLADTAGRRGVVPELRVDDLDDVSPEIVADVVRTLMVALAEAQPGEATVVVRRDESGVCATICMPTLTSSERLAQAAAAASPTACVSLDVVRLDQNRIWMEARWSPISV